MPRRSKAVNVLKIVRNGRTMFRARLTFPFNEELGFTPPPKDFYAATESEAIRKRKEYKPRIEGSDNETGFASFIEAEFIPYLHAKTKPQNGDERPASFLAFDNRRARLMNYLVSSNVKGVAGCALRSSRLGYLKPSMFEDFFKILVMSRIPSVKVMRELRTDLRMALSFAGRRVSGRPSHYLDSDFIDRELKRTGAKRNKPVFDYLQVLRAVTDPTKPLEHRSLVAFAFCTLSRPGEQFALTWDDIDLKNGTVTFDKATRLMEDENGRKVYAVGAGTKVEDGTIPLIDPALSLLRELKMRNQRRSRFVFLTKTGKPLHKERMKRLWSATKKSLGLPDLSYYRLKSTGNSFLGSKGIPAEVRAKIARWSDTRMATETYRTVADHELQAVQTVYADALRSIGISEAS